MKFLWKGPDKVTRLSVINTLDNGGLKLTDFETHIKALKLSWILHILHEREDPWISYLKYNLKRYGGCFLFRCNYDVNDLDLSFSLPYRIASETYVWSFQYRMLNFILFYEWLIIQFTTDVLNYLIILGKITIWESRKKKISPNFRLFRHKVEAKQEAEKIIALKNRKQREFYKRWELLLSV